jgi:hypothetical protein
VLAQNFKPQLYLDPLLGLGMLFSKVDMYINDVKVGLPVPEDFRFVWQSINRWLTNDEFCRQKFGRTFPHLLMMTEWYNLKK